MLSYCLIKFGTVSELLFCFVLFLLFIYLGMLSSDAASVFLCSPSSTRFFQLGWMRWWSLSNDQTDKIVHILWDYFHCSSPHVRWIYEQIFCFFKLHSCTTCRLCCLFSFFIIVYFGEKLVCSSTDTSREPLQNHWWKLRLFYQWYFIISQ